MLKKSFWLEYSIQSCAKAGAARKPLSTAAMSGIRRIIDPPKAVLFCLTVKNDQIVLEDILQPKLNLPFRRTGSVHPPRVDVARSVVVEQCRVGNAKVGMIR